FAGAAITMSWLRSNATVAAAVIASPFMCVQNSARCSMSSPRRRGPSLACNSRGIFVETQPSSVLQLTDGCVALGPRLRGDDSRCWAGPSAPAISIDPDIPRLDHIGPQLDLGVDAGAQFVR